MVSDGLCMLDNLNEINEIVLNDSKYFAEIEVFVYI